ncbi:8946_t:CDS:2 [Funneliformis geosporum]|nr:8946_t:CDS:2 [Funneliformis geosporum]
MTGTAGQLLSHVVPVCQWIPQNSTNPSSTISAIPWFPNKPLPFSSLLTPPSATAPISATPIIRITLESDSSNNADNSDNSDYDEPYYSDSSHYFDDKDSSRNGRMEQTLEKTGSRKIVASIFREFPS